MRIATHDGSFHADEVFAVATLQLLGDPVEVVRSRDPEVLADADLRVDVGFRNDPSTGDFDHHQRDFTRIRPNGVRYAAFGLVWHEFGTRLCGGDAAAAAGVDATLVQSLDAGDTGQRLTELVVADVHPISLGGVIAGLNAHWDETPTPEQEQERFAEAVALARGILEREIASVASSRRAEALVAEAIADAARHDPRIVELAVNAPWKRTLVPAAPEALYVIYPKRQGFGLEAVPRQLGTFEVRRALPEAWGGLEADALVEVTGVADARFCHAKRFLAVAGSREGIGRLAELALEPGESS